MRLLFFIAGIVIVIFAGLFAIFRPYNELTFIVYEQVTSPASGPYSAGQFYLMELDEQHQLPVTRPGDYVRYIGKVRDERLLILNYTTQTLDLISLTGKTLRSLPINILSFDSLRAMSVPANGNWLVSSYPSVVSRLNLQSGEEESILQDDSPLISFNPLGYLSPDGKWIAILTQQDSEIYDSMTIVPFDGQGAYETVSHLNIESISLLWSQDSQWIAFETVSHPPQIYRAKRDGSQLKSLTFAEADWIDIQTWSNKWIYLTAFANHHYYLYRVDTNRNEYTQVTTLPDSYCCIHFSSDNRWMTYQYGDGMYRVNLNTGEITSMGQMPVNVHTWTADSRNVIVGAWENDDVSLYRMNPDGSELHELVRTPGKRYYLTTTLSPEPHKWHPWRMLILAAGLIGMAIYRR